MKPLTPRQRLEQKKLDEELREIRSSMAPYAEAKAFGKGFVGAGVIPSMYALSNMSLLNPKNATDFVNRKENEKFISDALQQRGMQKNKADIVARKFEAAVKSDLIVDPSKGTASTVQKELNKMMADSLGGGPSLKNYKTLMDEGKKLNKGKRFPEFRTLGKGLLSQGKKVVAAPLLIGLLGGIYGINRVKENKKTYNELFKGANVNKQSMTYFSKELQKIANEMASNVEDADNKALIKEEGEDAPKEIIRKVDQEIKTPGNIFGTEIQKMESGRVKAFPMFEAPEGYVFNKDLQAFLPDASQAWMKEDDIGFASAKREGYIQAKKEAILQKMQQPMQSPSPSPMGGGAPAPSPIKASPMPTPQAPRPSPSPMQGPAPKPMASTPQPRMASPSPLPRRQ